MSIIACDKVPIFDKITENIYIGDIVAATSPTINRNVDVIISLVEISNNMKCFIFPLEDSRDVNISLLFNDINKLISKNIEQNKNIKILINCYNGVSRSVTILLAYFISIGITLKDDYY